MLSDRCVDGEIDELVNGQITWWVDGGINAWYASRLANRLVRNYLVLVHCPKANNFYS